MVSLIFNDQAVHLGLVLIKQFDFDHFAYYIHTISYYINPISSNGLFLVNALTFFDMAAFQDFLKISGKPDGLSFSKMKF
ncbi:hypothetical protein ACM44_08005 [Chryseobacterium koreense CCUG 49689]|uniref:Uncharacterized protein n=1 Tax=Chryseobacterium koreense CCUG 49689 TaxID=1304281 RepID=A0A0J7IZ83_9FLAO|nr:hypothetical protein ACM44_08005 [Chryseobacterium koreense CCUG 49689]MBB5332767.1 hypothetical protein [Chryseobacterium koreense]